jgi:hypothetical protein
MTEHVEQAGIPAPTRFVVPAPWPESGRLLRMPLHLADRPLVTTGQRVEPGQPVIEHFRNQEAVDIPTSAALIGLRPGDVLDNVPVPQTGRLGRKSTGGTYRTRVVEHGRDGVTRLVAGSGAIVVAAPATGIVESVTPSHIDLRAEGLAVDARVGWGRPSSGRIFIAVDGPDAEIPASRIDVAASGAILVVGARIDMEAMSRARAIGAAAVISGGVASRHLRQLESSEARQQAALHAAAPFGLLALGGYGRVPIPEHLWALLTAAEGRQAGIHAASRTLIIDGDPAPLLEAASRPPGTVRTVSGSHRDHEGRLVGLSGPRRWAGGAYVPGGFVELTGADGRPERHCVPLTTLERLGPPALP